MLANPDSSISGKNHEPGLFPGSQQRSINRAIEGTLNSIGVRATQALPNELEAVFESGLSICVSYSSDPNIRAEDSKGMSFAVALRGYLRIKGPAPDGLSPLDHLDRLFTAISNQATGQFLVSFQYESTIYWRDLGATAGATAGIASGMSQGAPRSVPWGARRHPEFAAQIKHPLRSRAPRVYE
ncbi:hypothetical protein [Pseudomonas sp.]|uniref:hypothetical protein n=1 Tax=Pseudomonas sp. TaxID=306 RepID=UPI00290988C6|nr:hypothetical protein [Pseudomonas sp.]MDU4249266.1 hypothetical protein [Pseudomonas sp.]